MLILKKQSERPLFAFCLICVALGLAVILSLAGCSGTREIRPAGDPDEAREFLSAVLEAWKAGQTPEDLQNGSPVMYVSDVDWKDGASLKSYELSESPVEHGGEWRVTTLLTLMSAGKTEERRRAVYSVTIEPAIAIIRSDELN